MMALRIAIAIIFIYMGRSKLGAGHPLATAMFDHIGFPGGGSLGAYFVGTLEVVGGIMVLLGIYADLAAVWLSIIMIVAMLTVHRGGPVAGYFLPLSVLGGLLALIGVGAGPLRLVKAQRFSGTCGPCNRNPEIKPAEPQPNAGK